MSDGPRLSTVAVEAIEQVQDAWLAISADGAITPAEDALMDRAIGAGMLLSSQVDEAVKLTVTMIRRGPAAPSIRRRYLAGGPPPGPVLPAQIETP